MSVPLIYDYGKLPVYKRDEDFLFKALSYKQSQLDSSREKVQNIYDQISTLDLHRDVDKKYVNDKLKNVKDLTNRYVAGDLSDGYLMQYITSNLNDFADDTVLNAVTSTKKFKNELAEWETHRKAEDGTYNEKNYQYALQSNPNLQRWLQGEEAGTLYQGGSGFISYVDYNKKLVEEMPKAMKALKETYVERVPGSGIFYDKVTMERVSKEKMRKVMEAVIGEDGYRQMNIDAWSESQGMSDEDVLNSYKGRYASLLAEESRTIAGLKGTKVTEANKDQIQQLIESTEYR